MERQSENSIYIFLFQGAVSGQIVGTLLTLWMSVGQAIYDIPFKFKNIQPLSVAGCMRPPIPVATLASNITAFINTTMGMTHWNTSMDGYTTADMYQTTYLMDTTPFATTLNMSNYMNYTTLAPPVVAVHNSRYGLILLGENILFIKLFPGHQ